MLNIIKKSKVIYLAVLLSIVPVALFSQQYQIRDVTYDITGSTQEYPLRQAVDIDTKKVFQSKESLDVYVADLHTQFQSIRVLESVSIIPTLGRANVENIIPVDLRIVTEDTFNIIVAPYPRFDSNDGFSFKIDSKNYNFLGSMQTLDAEVSYEFDFKDPSDPLDKDTHTIGSYASFTYPFGLGPVDLTWKNTLGLSYTIGESEPGIDFASAINATYPINDIISISLGLTQGISYDVDYKRYDDAFYFSEIASFSIPVTLVKTESLGSIKWTPSVSATYYWDLNGINTANEDLYDTTLDFGHSFSLGRVDWFGNFKNGFTFSFSQSLEKEMYMNKFSINNTINASYFKAFKHIGLKSRLYLLDSIGADHEVGDYVRGVRNDYIDTNAVAIINLDLPIKVWQTDWVRYGLWDWTRYLNFELQISPFVDIALGYNPVTNSTYSPKDGWYAGGIEVVGYLNEARSIVGRISGGVDLVQAADKVGDHVSFIDTAVNALFNTSWRSKANPSWYEFSFGIGLFY